MRVTYPKAVRDLDYFRGTTQLSAVPARLTWTGDDRLRLEALDTAGAPIETLFEAAIRDVAIGGGFTTPSFSVAGAGYRVDFSMAARTGSFSAASTSGVAQWMHALRAAGAKSHYWSATRIAVWSTASTIGFVILLFLALVIKGTIDGTFELPS
ncbi:hypothetical protein SAMN06295943_3324 [Agreia sp. VKM Ac-1783]|nr:hypothetical protein SAMN06295943_3324 [Agreia sp. VKM Ac-1783]